MKKKPADPKKKPTDKKSTEKKSSGVLRNPLVDPSAPRFGKGRPGRPNFLAALAVLALVAISVSLVFAAFAGSPAETVNDKAALSEVLAKYHSGAYAEIVVEGDYLSAKKPVKQKIV